MYFGEYMFFDQPFNLIFEPLRDFDTGKITDRLVLDTIVFHTYILMNLFNQINCRVIDAAETNVFKTLCNNMTFWVIFIFELAIQFGMLKVAEKSTLGSALLGVAPLNMT